MYTYRNSKQRTKILELLQNTNTHPTAQSLYDSMKSEYPHLSLGTIYRNLNILEKTGKIQKLQYGSTFDRFDAKMDPHYHFICRSCGRIYDLPLSPMKSIEAAAAKVTEHSIDSHTVDFFGVCSDCSKDS